MRNKKILLLSALFTASAAVISCGGGGGGGSSTSSSNQTAQQQQQQQKVATVQGNVPQDIQLAPDADTRAITGVKDVVAILKDGTIVDGYFINGGKNFVVQGVPVGEEAAIAFIDRKVTQGQNVPEDAKILAATPYIKVENTQVKVEITQVDPDGKCEVKVIQGGEPTNEVPPTGVTLAEVIQQQQQQQQVAQQANQTQGTFFGQAEKGWLTKKVVGPYEIEELDDIHINGQPLPLNNPRYMAKVGDYVYVFDNGTNPAIYYIDLKDKKAGQVTVEDTSDSGSKLQEFDTGYQIPGTNIVVNIDKTHSLAHLITLNGTQATAYSNSVKLKLALINATTSIKAIKEVNNIYYITLYNGTNLAELIFDPSQKSAQAIDVVDFPYNPISAFGQVDNKYFWVRGSDNKLYLTYYDEANQQWYDKTVSAPLATGANNFFSGIDLNGDGSADSFNGTNILDFKFLEADTSKAVFAVTLQNATLDANANDTAAFIARAKVNGNNIVLDTSHTLAYQLNGTGTEQWRIVGYKKDTDRNAYYIAFWNSTNATHVVYVKEKSDGTYDLINTVGTANNTMATITNALALDSAFNNITFKLPQNKIEIDPNTGFADFVTKTNSTAQVVYIADGDLRSSALLNSTNISPANAVGRISTLDAIPNSLSVIVADNSTSNKEVSYITWNITDGWKLVTETKVGKDEYGNDINGPYNNIVAIDANTYILDANSNATIREYWLFKKEGDTIVRSKYGIPKSNIGNVTQDFYEVNIGTGNLIYYYANYKDLKQWGIDGLNATLPVNSTVSKAYLAQASEWYYIGNNANNTLGANFIAISHKDDTDAYVISELFTGTQAKDIPLIAVSGAAKKAFAVDVEGNIYAIDLSDPAKPQIVGQGVIGFEPNDAAISTDGKYFYVVGSNVVAKVDTTGNIVTTKPEKITITEGQSTHTLDVPLDKVAYAGDYIVIAGHVDYTLSGSTVSKALIRVLKSDDLSPVSDWITVATDTPANATAQPQARINELYAVGKYIYLHYTARQAGTDDLVTISVQNPEKPQIVSTITGVTNLSVTGSGKAYAQAPGNSSQIKVISLANPANPTITAVTDISELTSDTNHLTGYGNYIFVDNRANHISIIDLTDPKNPVYSGDIWIPRTYGVTSIKDISVNTINQDTYLFVATDKGLLIYDLNPLELK